MKLRELLEAWLVSIGCTFYLKDGERLWGHPSLGHGRPFMETLAWVLGCEQAGRDLRAEADTYAEALAHPAGV